MILTSTEIMPQPTITFHPETCEEGMQKCTGQRYYKVCIGGKWSEPELMLDTRLCCKQYGRIVRIEQ